MNNTVKHYQHSLRVINVYYFEGKGPKLATIYNSGIPAGGGEERASAHGRHDGGDAEQAPGVCPVLPVEHPGPAEVR